MRGWVVCALLLAGCQSSPSVKVVVNATPTRVGASQAEPSEEKKLDRPPADKAKDLTRPEETYQPDPTSRQPIRLRESEMAITPAFKPNPPSASQFPAPPYPVATPKNRQPSPAVAPPQPPSPKVQLPRTTYPNPQASVVANVPPARPRPPLPPNARPTGYPGVPRASLPPGAMSPKPPQLPGQATPPQNRGYDPQRERQLEQAYRQSRADALNLKYHGGRAVLDANSPQVTLSAQAPLPPMMPPSIPGHHGVVDAFKASEVKRQEWQNYRQAPMNPAVPMPPGVPGRF